MSSTWNANIAPHCPAYSIADVTPWSGSQIASERAGDRECGSKQLTHNNNNNNNTRARIKR